MPISRSLSRSRRHLSQRQENWFSMRPVEALHPEGETNSGSVEKSHREESSSPRGLLAPTDV